MRMLSTLKRPLDGITDTAAECITTNNIAKFSHNNGRGPSIPCNNM